MLKSRSCRVQLISIIFSLVMSDFATAESTSSKNIAVSLIESGALPQILTDRVNSLYYSEIKLTKWNWFLPNDFSRDLVRKVSEISETDAKKLESLLPGITKAANFYSASHYHYRRGANGVWLRSDFAANGKLSEMEKDPELKEAVAALKLPEYFAYTDHTLTHYSAKKNAVTICETDSADLPFNVAMVDALASDWMSSWSEIKQTISISNADNNIIEFKFTQKNYLVTIRLKCDGLRLTPISSIVTRIEDRSLVFANFWFYDENLTFFHSGDIEIPLPRITFRMSRRDENQMYLQLFIIDEWQLKDLAQNVDLSIPYTGNPKIEDQRLEIIPSNE